MRSSWPLLFLAACGAGLESGPGASGNPDAPAGSDANVAIDAPPDARACTGGTASASVADGSCVIFFSTPASFVNAAAQCTANNSTLAILNTAARDTAARSLIGTANVFIGLSDTATEGTFVWIDGTPLVFENFVADEPNNAGGVFQEDCVIYSGTRAGWDDRPCSNDVPGIGETPGENPYLCMF